MAIFILVTLQSSFSEAGYVCNLNIRIYQIWHPAFGKKKKTVCIFMSLRQPVVVGCWLREGNKDWCGKEGADGRRHGRNKGSPRIPVVRLPRLHQHFKNVCAVYIVWVCCMQTFPLSQPKAVNRATLSSYGHAQSDLLEWGGVDNIYKEWAKNGSLGRGIPFYALKCHLPFSPYITPNCSLLYSVDLTSYF